MKNMINDYHQEEFLTAKIEIKFQLKKMSKN
jgi:hypothetical protein